MIDDDDLPARIGTSEREAARQALITHLEAGRLDADEYAERAAQVSTARTAADLEPLFADLPAPRPPVGSGVAPTTTSPSRTPAAAGSQPTAPGTRRRDSRPALGGRLGEVIVTASPVLAVILFFVLNNFVSAAWVVFLLIPLTGAIVYGRGWRGE